MKGKCKCLLYLVVTILDFAILRIIKLITVGGQHVILGKQLPKFPDLVAIDTAVGHAHDIDLKS